MAKSNRISKNWSKTGRTNLGSIYSCPNCNNQNKQPLLNSDEQPYCSSCLVNFGVMYIMVKRTAYGHYTLKK